MCLHGTAVNPVGTVQHTRNAEAIAPQVVDFPPEPCTCGHVRAWLCPSTRQQGPPGRHRGTREYRKGGGAGGGGAFPPAQLLQEKTSRQAPAWMEAREGRGEVEVAIDCVMVVGSGVSIVDATHKEKEAVSRRWPWVAQSAGSFV